MSDANRSVGIPVEASPPEVPTEKQLLLRHRNGDPDAFRAFVARYQASVYAFIQRSGVPEADREDVFQDTFIRIHRAANRYQPERPLSPWVFTVVVNTIRSYFRQRHRRGFVLDAQVERLASPGPSAESRVKAQQTLERIECEICELPSTQREALLLAVVQNLSMHEIAEVLEVPVGTVKTWLRRARARLMERLKEHL
ncbi:MAG TPA: RNA polymerase sigma factor [Vicinamibacteria bacterium]|nr:RNA polymerase sigma factor [Vicinamibacteria bacterium]